MRVWKGFLTPRWVLLWLKEKQTQQGDREGLEGRLNASLASFIAEGETDSTRGP